VDRINDAEFDLLQRGYRSVQRRDSGWIAHPHDMYANNELRDVVAKNLPKICGTGEPSQIKYGCQMPGMIPRHIPVFILENSNVVRSEEG
jgi:hypothetical protein